MPLFVFGAGAEVADVGRGAFNKFFTENALGGARAFPSLKRLKNEIAMGLDLFHAPAGAAGFMINGGTESIAASRVLEHQQVGVTASARGLLAPSSP